MACKPGTGLLRVRLSVVCAGQAMLRSCMWAMVNLNTIPSASGACMAAATCIICRECHPLEVAVGFQVLQAPLLRASQSFMPSLLRGSLKQHCARFEEHRQNAQMCCILPDRGFYATPLACYRSASKPM